MSITEILENLVNAVVQWAATAGVKIIIALIIMWIGFKITNSITRKLEKRIISRGKLDKTLVATLFYVVRIVLKVIILAGLVGYLGVDTSGVAALIASLGVGVGLAVNGALSNFAGGVLILITRPFKIDDYIEIESTGCSGTVEDIHIVFTKIRTVDNKLIYVPNGTLSTATIINYSSKDLRRVDLVYSISKDEDYQKAEAVILATANEHTLVLKDPAATARIDKHTANDMQVVLKAWVKNADYWTVYYDLQESIKNALDKNGIAMPANQLDVRVKKD